MEGIGNGGMEEEEGWKAERSVKAVVVDPLKRLPEMNVKGLNRKGKELDRNL